MFKCSKADNWIHIFKKIKLTKRASIGIEIKESMGI